MVFIWESHACMVFSSLQSVLSKVQCTFAILYRVCPIYLFISIFIYLFIYLFLFSCIFFFFLIFFVLFWFCVCLFFVVAVLWQWLSFWNCMPNIQGSQKKKKKRCHTVKLRVSIFFFFPFFSGSDLFFLISFEHKLLNFFMGHFSPSSGRSNIVSASVWARLVRLVARHLGCARSAGSGQRFAPPGQREQNLF